MQLLNPDGVVTAGGVLGALLNGDACNLSDARIGNTVLEYDEGHWHQAARRWTETSAK